VWNPPQELGEVGAEGPTQPQSQLPLSLTPSFSISESALGFQGRKTKTPQMVVKGLQEPIMHHFFLQAD